MKGGAEISEDKAYRWWLMRQWDPSLTMGAFCSLNPSTADADVDDATIRKDIGFATRWGWGGFYKFNLFPYRSTDPRSLWAVDDPVGPRGDEMIEQMATRQFDRIVAAWGVQKHPRFTARVARVRQLLDGVPLWSIGAPTKDGHPRHPLYLPYKSMLQPWPADAINRERVRLPNAERGGTAGDSPLSVDPREGEQARDRVRAATGGGLSASPPNPGINRERL